MNSIPAPSPRTGESFLRRERISKRREFLQVYEHGRKEFCRHVVIFSLANEFGHARIGITATKKLGKAHVRNKVKRWVREVFRRRRDVLGLSAIPIDMVVNLKSSAATVQFGEFAEDLAGGMRRAASRFRPA